MYNCINLHNILQELRWKISFWITGNIKKKYDINVNSYQNYFKIDAWAPFDIDQWIYSSLFQSFWCGKKASMPYANMMVQISMHIHTV